MEEYYCYGVEVGSAPRTCIDVELHICVYYYYYWQKKEERSGHPLGPFTSPNTLFHSDIPPDQDTHK